MSPYFGESVQELDTFLCANECIHEAYRNYEDSQLPRIGLAAAWLRGDIAEAWEREMIEMSYAHSYAYTWKMFKGFLKLQLNE